jgi:integrase
MRDFILLALLTGARRANLCAMHWREINLADSVWRIPRHEERHPAERDALPGSGGDPEGTPRKRPRAVSCSLAPGATATWWNRRRRHSRSWSGPASPTGATRPNGVTLHDLRRTLGSWQARTGASLAIIGKSLNHKSQQATAIYARLDLDPVRAAVNTATAAMLEAGGMKAGADVVQLPKQGKA